MKSFFLKRLREPSTWAGIVALAAGLGGFQLDEEQRQAVIQLGLAIAGVLFVFTREQTASGEKVVSEIESTVLGNETTAPNTGYTDAVYRGPAPTAEPKQPPTRGLVGRVNRNKR